MTKKCISSLQIKIRQVFTLSIEYISTGTRTSSGLVSLTLEFIPSSMDLVVNFPCKYMQFERHKNVHKKQITISLYDILKGFIKYL